MIRRLNYTGRIKINRGDVHLSIRPIDAGIGFDARIDLTDYELPGDALVFVEAYRQTTWMRFSFGTIDNLIVPQENDRKLSDFDSADGILFRVKVTQKSDEHILLAVADRVSLAMPEVDAARDSLLPVVPVELKDQLWRVDLEDEPLLLINKSAAADWRQLAISPIFVSLVYPAAFREILNCILIYHEHRDIDDEDDWCSKWLRFASLLPNMEAEPPAKEEGEDAARDWTEAAVASFSTKLGLRQMFVDNFDDAGGL